LFVPEDVARRQNRCESVCLLARRRAERDVREEHQGINRGVCKEQNGSGQVAEAGKDGCKESIDQRCDYGLEALPLLRRTLAEDDASMVIHSAECIAKLGPEAATCPAGEADQPIAESGCEKGDLFDQLRLRGAKIWSYSGYANAYASCLDALVKLEYEPDFLVEHVQMHIGLGTDALIDSLEALSSIGTSEARDLAKRAVTFYTPEFNASEKKKATAILASFGKSKKAKK
jgi:hypothetical protein